MRTRRIINKGIFKSAAGVIFILTLLGVMNFFMALATTKENGPICGGVIFLLFIPLIGLMVMILRSFPYAIYLGGREVVFRCLFRSTSYRYDDLVQVEYVREKTMLHINTDSDLNEIGYIDPGPDIDMGALIKERIPKRQLNKQKELSSLEPSEYMEMIIKKLDRKGVGSEEMTLDGTDFLVLSERRGKDVLARYREFFYLKEVDGSISLKEVQRICKVTRAYTNTKFRYPYYWRMTQAYTVPVLISKTGFSEEVINFVTDNRIGERGGDSVYPVLIDLFSCRLTTLENYQVRPGNQVDNLPTRNHVNGLRNLLSIRGHVVALENKFTPHSMKSRKKIAVKKVEKKIPVNRELRIEGRFKYIRNRWTMPTVLIFVLIIPPVCFLFALLMLIIFTPESIGFALGSIIFGCICIGVMWGDLTRKESITIDEMSISCKSKKVSTIIPLKNIRSVSYFRNGEEMGVGVVSNNTKVILAEYYYRKEDKEALLGILLEIGDEYGFEVFNSKNANNLLYHMKRRLSN